MEVLESVSILQPILNSIMQKIIKANSVNDWFIMCSIYQLHLF
jgi:hypothetical protein